MELTVIPEEVHRLDEFRTLRPPRESGMVHRRNAWAPWGGNLPGWVLLWQNATVDERDELRTLYDQTRGGSVSMTWTPPGGTSTVVRFVEDSFSWDPVTATQFAMRITLEEVK